jgi:hypothetical protein
MIDKREAQQAQAKKKAERVARQREDSMRAKMQHKQSMAATREVPYSNTQLI